VVVVLAEMLEVLELLDKDLLAVAVPPLATIFVAAVVVVVPVKWVQLVAIHFQQQAPVAMV
jgi:hypothetical protein